MPGLDQPAGQKCRECKQDVIVRRRHVSPAHLGAPLVTEYHECPACGSGFMYNPATGKLKPWTNPDGDN